MDKQLLTTNINWQSFIDYKNHFKFNFSKFTKKKLLDYLYRLDTLVYNKTEVNNRKDSTIYKQNSTYCRHSKSYIYKFTKKNNLIKAIIVLLFLDREENKRALKLR